MRNKRIRYFHDPVHGSISFPFEIVQQLIDHPILQRLRRISQCGLSHYVFPGANHTRFHHSLGVAHLAYKVLNTLKSKGVDISDTEMQSTIIAALMHDVGHGPFSHALEGKIIAMHHESITALLIKQVNKEFDGALSEAISILKKEHPKKFLSQLVASQLDVDRMDYLTRDSFYTGVEEGRLGLDRLIRTFNVQDNQLVTEVKALQTVEKFLVARHHMYWQVYLHKTVLALQQMLILFLERTKMLLTEGVKVSMSKPLLSLLTMEEVQAHPNHGIFFPQIDDISIIDSIKRNQFHKDKALSYICTSLLERKIFSLQWTNHQKKGYLNPNKSPIIPTDSLGLNDENFSLIKEGTESIHSYNLEEEIFIMYSDQTIVPLSKVSEVYFKDNILSKSFICYPRFI